MPELPAANPEHDEDQHGAGDRGELRTIQDVPETGFAADAFVGGGAAWRWMNSMSRRRQTACDVPRG